MELLVIIAFVVLALLGLPLFVVIGGLALILYTMADIGDIEGIVNEMYTLATQPVLLTIPLFTFAGYLMAESKAPQRLVRDGGEVVAVDGHGAVLGVVEAGDQLGHGGLAGAGGPDDGHHLAGVDGKIHVTYHRCGRVVPERHALQPDLALDRRQLVGSSRLGHRRFGGEHAGQLGHRRLALLVDVVEGDQLGDGGEERPDVEQECHQLADGDRPLQHQRRVIGGAEIA